MIDKKTVKNRRQLNRKRLLQLTRLNLEQLNQINGGSGNPSGPEPDFGPDGVCVN